MSSAIVYYCRGTRIQFKNTRLGAYPVQGHGAGMPLSIAISGLHICNMSSANGGLVTIQIVPLMWNYIIGPILALLPSHGATRCDLRAMCNEGERLA
jgi:hypothetical protein